MEYHTEEDLCGNKHVISGCEETDATSVAHLDVLLAYSTAHNKCLCIQLMVSARGLLRAPSLKITEMLALILGQYIHAHHVAHGCSNRMWTDLQGLRSLPCFHYIYCCLF